MLGAPGVPAATVGLQKLQGAAGAVGFNGPKRADRGALSPSS